MRRLEEMAHHLPPEVRAELEEVIRCLLPYAPQRVILFGSYARGDYHTQSDLDLIVVKETEDRFAERIGKVLELCAGHPRVEPLVYTPQELEEMLARGNDFISTVLAEGVLLYEQPAR